MAGTTDSPIELTHLPAPREEDIRFVLEEIKHYLSPDISGKVVHLILVGQQWLEYTHLCDQYIVTTSVDLLTDYLCVCVCL